MVNLGAKREVMELFQAPIFKLKIFFIMKNFFRNFKIPHWVTQIITWILMVIQIYCCMR